MNSLQIVGCALIGFVMCWALIAVIRKLSMGTGALNRTGQYHHTHLLPVPRLGGIALAGAFVAVSILGMVLFSSEDPRLATDLVIILASLAMFGLGLWDDFRPLSAKVKLLGQIIIATVTYFGGIRIDVLKVPFADPELSLGLWGLGATIFWLVALTNLINLIDGIDGLAGGVSFMLMCLLAYVGMMSELPFSTLVGVGMAGALLGFLYFNFPPAKIYMGDGGAYFLGFLIGVLSITHSHKGTIAAALIAPIFALALPIVDVSMAIMRRGLKGLPVFRPDRKHIHHHLVNFGFSRRRTVLILYAVSLLFLFVALGVFWSQGRLMPIAVGFLFLILVISARSFGFIQDWFAMGSLMGKAFELRKETRYALALSRWLELEAERCQSIQEIWVNFQFVATKLGFVQVKLILDDGERSWQRNGAVERCECYFERHEFQAEAMTLEFSAEKNVMEETRFKHLVDLAAETWMKAVEKWTRLHQLPARFSPDSTLERLQQPVKNPGLSTVA